MLASPQHWMVDHEAGDLKMTSEGQDRKCCVQAEHTRDRTMQGDIMKLCSTCTGGVDVRIPSEWHKH